jgi:PTS system galactosamine-specific IIC component
MTTVISIVSRQSAQAALGLSLPFAIMAQGIGIFCYTTFAGFLRPLDKAAANADTKKFATIVIGASLLRALFMAILAFVSTYVLQRQLSDFISVFPEKLIHGFEVAGNLMPAVGLALLLVVTLKKQNFAYLFIGFITVIITNAQNILPVAILASAIAYIGYVGEERNEERKGGGENGI